MLLILIEGQDLGMFSPKFFRERRKSFVHRVFSIRSITPGHGKVLAFILGLKLAPTSNGRAKVAATREVYLVRHAEKSHFGVETCHIGAKLIIVLMDAAIAGSQ